MSMDTTQVCRMTHHVRSIFLGIQNMVRLRELLAPGLEGPRKPVARTGPVHVFILGSSPASVLSISPSLGLPLFLSPVTCTRFLARSLAH